MATGRKQKPTALKILQGNPGRRPINRAEPKMPSGADVPACPEWLGVFGRALWEQQAPIHHEVGTLTDADLPAFAAMCEAWDVYRRAAVVIRDDLTYISPANGEATRPEVGIRKQALADFVKLAAEFGLTPASRAKIHAKPPGEQDDPVRSFEARRPRRPA